VYAVLEAVSLAVLYTLLNATVGSQSDAAKEIFGFSVADFTRHIPISDPVIATCLLLVIIIAVKNIIGYSSQVFGYFNGYRVWGDVQQKIFEKNIRSEYLPFLETKQGEVVYQTYTAPSYLGSVLNVIPQVLVEVVKMAVMVVVLFTMAFKLALVMMGFTFFYFLITRYVAKNVSYHFGRGRLEANHRQNVLIAEMYNGFRQIKLFHAENRWIDEFKRAMHQYFTFAKKDSMCLSAPKHLLDFVFMAGLTTVIVIIQLNDPRGLMGMLPVLGILVYAFTRIVPSLNVFSNNIMQMMGALPNLEKLHTILEEGRPKMNDGQHILEGFRSDIAFKNVTFAYSGRPEVLKNVFMRFQKGCFTGIIGPSGSGKTTIVDLIIRLFDPNEGVITIDGVDIKQIRLSSWLSRIGYVSQDTFIFNATIRENISFGSPSVTDSDIVQATKDANAYDFIMDLPEGIDTVVGDRGLKLSGGQRQRIAIARALARNPDILILDEATSALDSKSEAEVQDAVARVAKKRTVIAIAHRFSTVRNADVIYVLENASIVESGNHEELMRHNGRYRHYYDIQTKERAIVQ
jgi:ABC-type multidrug transport system fused ATPase/permease subunit